MVSSWRAYFSNRGCILALSMAFKKKQPAACSVHILWGRSNCTTHKICMPFSVSVAFVHPFHNNNDFVRNNFGISFLRFQLWLNNFLFIMNRSSTYFLLQSIANDWYHIFWWNFTINFIYWSFCRKILSDAKKNVKWYNLSATFNLTE